MNDSQVVAALARGAWIVTPNKRLARAITLEHDRAQHARGLRAWPACRALTWQTFVGELWQLALDAGVALPAHRLDIAQCAHLWQRSIARDLSAAPLVDAAALANLAVEAWELVHAYGAGGEPWRSFSGSGGDSEAFARWCAAFVRETVALKALDPSRAPDAIAGAAEALPGVDRLDIVCTGFLELSPQQRRVLDALGAAGAKIECCEPGDTQGIASAARLANCATPREELQAALAWACEHASQRPESRVGIVVLDLARRRAMVRALAEDVLCPALQWPGEEGAPRPYDISAGDPLDAVPLCAIALDVIALAHGPLAVGDAAVLLRSPYLPDAGALRDRRAGLEVQWLEGGRRELTLRSLVASLRALDPALAQRFASLERLSAPARAAPRAWAEFWREWLATVGWCERQALSAAEQQARAAWSDLLANFARLGAVAPQLSARDAQLALRRTARSQIFQPAALGARVEILGMLEAAGSRFDALWVAGCSSEAWPQAPEPNPLLPIGWQRERGVPRSHPGRELDYARRVTASLSRGASEVVFSYASRIDDHASRPSPLIEHLPPRSLDATAFAPSAHAAFASRPGLERIADATAPPLPAGAPLKGGSRIVEAQSTCPFQAVARCRLRVEPWPNEIDGLTPPERGKIVHAAFAAFWTQTKDQRALNALDDASLGARIREAVQVGLRAIDPTRWSMLPPVVAAGEGDRVAALMKQWLTEVEAARPPFRVLDNEVKAALTLAGHPVTLRIDRIDTLADGRAVVLDYKSGWASAPDRWFAQRPQAPQLLLYAMACEQDGFYPPIAALAYAQLRAGEHKLVGLAAEDVAWPALATPTSLRSVELADWAAAQRHWEQAIAKLADEIDAGDARVAPRNAKACALCKLQPLCRVASIDEGEEAAEARDD